MKNKEKNEAPELTNILEKDALEIINKRYNMRYRSLKEINLAEILSAPPTNK